jgi:diadenosine tetraphosphatase ApaH/serine/threonine PP2A family protein phosphatase
MLNPGSVGQPRDGNPASSYLVVDLAAATLEFRRVAYDIERTQALMREARLPTWLVERLSLGR